MTPSTNEMPPALLPTLTDADNKKYQAGSKRKLTEAIGAAGRIFNVRLLKDERVLTPGAWLLRTMIHLGEASAPIEGRSVPPMMLEQEIVALWREVAVFEPRLLLNAPVPEKLPEPWRWEFNGQPLPNPFRPETVDLTSQAWLREHEPALAALLEVEAKGGPSYRDVAEQKAKAAREVEAAKYAGPNPWDPAEAYATETARGFAQADIIRASPELAERLKAEAQSPALVNPWAHGTYNLTRQARIATDNPFLAHVAKLAAVHQNAQRDRELADAASTVARLQFEKADAANAERRRARAV